MVVTALGALNVVDLILIESLVDFLRIIYGFVQSQSELQAQILAKLLAEATCVITYEVDFTLITGI